MPPMPPATLPRPGLPARLTMLTCTMLLAPAGPALAQPAPAVALDSAVFVERLVARDGEQVRALEPASRLVHGDRVVTLVSWTRASGNGGFTVTNALPRALAYQQSAEPDEEVSVDGGKSWGHLGSLMWHGRLATAEDVTHVRWHIAPTRAAAGAGRITYAGLVR